MRSNRRGNYEALIRRHEYEWIYREGSGSDADLYSGGNMQASIQKNSASCHDCFSIASCFSHGSIHVIGIIIAHTLRYSCIKAGLFQKKPQKYLHYSYLCPNMIVQTSLPHD